MARARGDAWVPTAGDSLLLLRSRRACGGSQGSDAATDAATYDLFLKAANNWGKGLAAAHARGDKNYNEDLVPHSVEKKIADLVDGSKSDFQAHVELFAKTYAAQVEIDYGHFKALTNADVCAQIPTASIGGLSARDSAILTYSLIAAAALAVLALAAFCAYKWLRGVVPGRGPGKAGGGAEIVDAEPVDPKELEVAEPAPEKSSAPAADLDV